MVFAGIRRGVCFSVPFGARRWAVRLLVPLLAPLLALLLLPFPALAQGGDAPAGSSGPSAAPEISFGESAVAVSGATPEGEVVLFSLGREVRAYVPTVLRREDLLTVDAEGEARLELDEPVVRRSVWAAVDLASGEYALAAPPGGELRRIDFPGRGLGANLRFLETEGRFLDLLLVRPAAGPEGEAGAGLWGVALGDGGSLDRDGMANSRVVLDLLSVEPLTDGPPPLDRLRPKDVVIGVDPTALTVFAARLADGPDDGSGDGGGGGSAPGGEE